MPLVMLMKIGVYSYLRSLPSMRVNSHAICLFFPAIDLIDEIPPKECEERVVCCDGGDPHLGHPKVYINLVIAMI